MSVDDLMDLWPGYYLWMSENLDMVLPVAALCSLALVAGIVAYASRKKSRGDKMPRLPEGEKILVEDVIVDAFELLYILGKMSRKRTKYWYARLGKELELNGLLRRKAQKMLHPFKVAALKKRIQDTRAAEGYQQPVPLPKEEKSRTRGNMPKPKLRRVA